MNEKEPVILVTLLQAVSMRWSVAAIGEDRTVRPLVQSQPGDLSDYATPDFDEQVSFLRHRIAGSLQRGADRLWPLNLKASLFVVWFDPLFAADESALIHRVADNFVQWIVNPPVVCFHGRLIAGDLNDEKCDSIAAAMKSAVRIADDESVWETIPRKHSS